MPGHAFKSSGDWPEKNGRPEGHWDPGIADWLRTYHLSPAAIFALVLCSGPQLFTNLESVSISLDYKPQRSTKYIIKVLVHLLALETCFSKLRKLWFLLAAFSLHDSGGFSATRCCWDVLIIRLMVDDVPDRGPFCETNRVSPSSLNLQNHLQSKWPYYGYLSNISGPWDLASYFIVILHFRMFKIENSCSLTMLVIQKRGC